MSLSGLYGAPNQINNTHTASDGEIVNSIDVNYQAEVDALTFHFSNNQPSAVGFVGSRVGNSNTNWSSDGGFSGIYGVGFRYINSIGAYKSDGTVIHQAPRAGVNDTDVNFDFNCPAGQVINSVTSSSGWYVDQIQVGCGYNCNVGKNAANANICSKWNANNAGGVSEKTIIEYCLTGSNMTSDPNCKQSMHATNPLFESALLGYCSGNTLSTDATFCNRFCDTKAGMCDQNRIAHCITDGNMITDANCHSVMHGGTSTMNTALTKYCSNDTLHSENAFCSTFCNSSENLCDTNIIAYCSDPNKLKTSPEVCGCYLPQTTYDDLVSQLELNMNATAKKGMDALYHAAPKCWFTPCSQGRATQYMSSKPRAESCPTVQVCIQNVQFNNEGTVIGDVHLDATCTQTAVLPQPIDTTPVVPSTTTAPSTIPSATTTAPFISTTTTDTVTTTTNNSTTTLQYWLVGLLVFVLVCVIVYIFLKVSRHAHTRDPSKHTANSKVVHPHPPAAHTTVQKSAHSHPPATHMAARKSAPLHPHAPHMTSQKSAPKHLPAVHMTAQKRVPMHS